ncbi:hypothetical protein [Streptomyces decoyicus]|uniref:hypothetical protein n=1 Tax=Streptomyces decoyicus TaxID=249567 RepID=UPI00386F99BB|nr:hypothetical protein OG532_37340 [Streptomyces decoyicus]
MDGYDAFARPHAMEPGTAQSVHLFSFAADWRFGAESTRHLHEQRSAAGLTVREHRDTSTAAGHDAFLLAAPGHLA